MAESRRKSFLTACLALCWALLACAAPAPGAEAARCRELVVSANPAYPPYHWEENGVLVGASLDLLKQALPAGVTARFVVYPWKRVLENARRGEIDLILSLRATPEREEYLVFTRAEAFSNPIVVFTRRDRVFALKDWAALKGRTGGMSSGDMFGCGFDEYWRRELTMDDAGDMERNFRKLDQGRIDYFVTGKYVGLAYAATNPYAAGVVVLEPPLCNEGIRFGFSKAGRCAGLVDAVNRRLEELGRQGVPERLLRQHLERLRQAPTAIAR